MSHSGQRSRGRAISFSGKLGDGLLNREWSWTRAEARVLIERWRRFCHEQRLHSAHHDQPPAQVRQRWLETTTIETRLPA